MYIFRQKTLLNQMVPVTQLLLGLAIIIVLVPDTRTSLVSRYELIPVGEPIRGLPQILL